MIERVGSRDVMQIQAGDCRLVVSCDSLGGIGLMDGDTVRADPFTVGYVGIRPALFEIVCVGAEPILLINNLTISMRPHGERIIEGMTRVLSRWKVKVFGSTEENIPTNQTGVGITLIGKTRELRVGLVKKGDLAVAFGEPRVGGEVLDADDVCTPQHILELLKYDIGEIIPTGSKGIAHEVRTLARDNQLNVRFSANKEFLSKSCGPSTVVVASVSPEFLDSIDVGLPMRVVGEFI